MNYVHDTVRDFGRSMGLESLGFDDNDLICLEFQTSGTLYLEYLPESSVVLAQLARQVPAYDTGAASRALEGCRHRREIPFPVNPGLMGDDRIVLTARINSEEFTLPRLSVAVALLKRMLGEIVAP